MPINQSNYPLRRHDQSDFNPLQAGDTWQPVVRQEDGQSDSSGETIPSDSGRGGSEEDISHSGHVGAALNGR